MLTPVQFEDYCSSITNTATWGGEPEIVALSRAFNIPIHIVQGGKPEIVVHEPDDERTNDKVVRISYHRKLYGLGEVSGWWSLSCSKSNYFFPNSIITRYILLKGILDHLSLRQIDKDVFASSQPIIYSKLNEI